MNPERRFSKVYFEITNRCGAACSFCPGHARAPRDVTRAEFLRILDQLAGRATYLYFHVMGDPLCHPLAASFAEEAAARGFRVMITTNGLYQEAAQAVVGTGAVYKISFSLHSYGANRFPLPLEAYLEGCFSAGEAAAAAGTLCAFRLWNRTPGEPEDGAGNQEILTALKRRFGEGWTVNRMGYRIRPRLFLEWGERFQWPGEAAESDRPLFCHALRSQIAILSDGTVVPCCLDGEGRMALGNLFLSPLGKILSSPRAVRLYDGFTLHRAAEPLCRTCGYARRFSAGPCP